MGRFFYIKKQQRNVEEHYWKGIPLSQPYPLTQSKIISEVVGLAFYQMMGVRTPKTYVSRANCGPIIMSQEMDSWKSCKAEPTYFNRQLEPLPSTVIGLAELELASAFLGDIDVTGWLYDNIGLQQMRVNQSNVLVITKHDAGSAIVEKEQYEHFKKYFKDETDEFPDGTLTLAENPELKNTYLKVFTKPSITKYNQQYRNIFLNVSPEMRAVALKKLLLITPEEISTMVIKISQELLLPEIKQKEIITFMIDRLTLFKMKFSKTLSLYISQDLNPKPPPSFKKLVEQKHIMRDRSYLTKRLEIQPKDENAPDYSQSSARYFKRVPKLGSEPRATMKETANYFE